MTTGIFDWLIRALKGAVIGIGFITPGISGGALATAFGLFQRLIEFLANITKSFKKNFLFFLPVGIGACLGVFLISFALKFVMEEYEAYFRWFFIGCILGTVPMLFKQSGEKGRKKSDISVFAITAVLGLAFLIFGQWMEVQMAQGASGELNFLTAFASGLIIAVGIVIPGLSSATLLLICGLYNPLLTEISSLNVPILIFVVLGILAAIFLLSKIVNFLFKKYYSGFYHFILGFVFASTIMITPTNFNYLSWETLVCALLCVAGIGLGLWMSKLESSSQEKEKAEIK